MPNEGTRKRSGLINHKPGDVLHCEDGYAVVVEPGTAPVDGLLTLVEEVYGGPQFEPTNPAIQEAAPFVRVSEWWSCTKAYREERCDDMTDDWWAEDGDGARRITVAYYEGSVYDVGEDAEAALAVSGG